MTAKKQKETPLEGPALAAAVLKVIEEHPSRYDQGVYVDIQNQTGVTVEELRAVAETDAPTAAVNPDRPVCQTTGCVAGWGAVLSSPRDWVIYSEIWIGPPSDTDLPPLVIQGSVPTVHSVAQQRFHVTEEQSDWLFAGCREPEEVKFALRMMAAGPLPEDVDLAEAYENYLEAKEAGDEHA